MKRQESENTEFRQGMPVRLKGREQEVNGCVELVWEMSRTAERQL